MATIIVYIAYWLAWNMLTNHLRDVFFILDTGSMTFTPREIMTKNTTDNNAVINEQWEHSPREYIYIRELSSITEGMSWKKTLERL